MLELESQVKLLEVRAQRKDRIASLRVVPNSLANQLLQDNLNQMNSYADQLELVISQCPSCTIKLQNESTQDSVVKNA